MTKRKNLETAKGGFQIFQVHSIFFLPQPRAKAARTVQRSGLLAKLGSSLG